MTDSDNESDEEVDFEVVYGRSCMTSLGRSVRDHHWCVRIYETGVILMVIRLGSNLYLQQKSVNRGLNSYRLPIFATSVRKLICSFPYFQLLINCTSGGVYVNLCKFIL